MDSLEGSQTITVNGGDDKCIYLWGLTYGGWLVKGVIDKGKKGFALLSPFLGLPK